LRNKKLTNYSSEVGFNKKAPETVSRFKTMSKPRSSSIFKVSMTKKNSST